MGGTNSRQRIFEKLMQDSSQLQCLNKTESPWQQTNLFQTKDEGPIVVKQLLKINDDQKFRQLQDQMSRIRNTFDPERRHPNLMLYHPISPERMNQSETLMLRQFICHNLTQKLSWMPMPLERIEKLWLAFQMLNACAQTHAESMVHGDIKPDNVLVASDSWLLLSDMHMYKPPSVKDDDLKLYNMYFGFLDNNTRCYIAPERWFSPGQREPYQQTTPAMDIFSAGCVIAEIFMDGIPLFDLAKMQKYRKGTYVPEEDLCKRIEDPQIVSLIMEMLSVNPAKRPTAQECVKRYTGTVFPECFTKVLFQLGASFRRLSQLYSDNRIGLLRYHAASLYETVLGQFEGHHNLHEPQEPAIFNLLEVDNAQQKFQQIQPLGLNVFHTASSSPEEMDTQDKIKEVDKEALLIVCLWLGNLMQSCFYPQSIMVGLEMIDEFAKHLPFTQRLSHVLPLLSKVFILENKKSTQIMSKINCKCLQVMLDLFPELHVASTQDIQVEALDYKVFQSYILPIIHSLMESSQNDQMVRYQVANSLGKIYRIGTRFLEVSISSLNKRRDDAIKRRQKGQAKNDAPEVETSDQLNYEMGPRGVTSSFVRGNTRELDRMENTNNMASHMDEELVGPNYDNELHLLWEDVMSFIQNFSSENDSQSVIAMLKQLPELSQIFGVEHSDFLIQQCFSGVNRKDLKVRLTVLRTLSMLSLRVGARKVSEYVLPLIETMLDDPEDLVILENIKTINQLVRFRLIGREDCLKLMDNLMPFLLYPSAQIRLQVATFFHILATLGHGDDKQAPQNLSGSLRVKLPSTPLFTQEEFFCMVRPQLMFYMQQQYKNDLMSAISNPKVLLTKMRSPLNLNIMRAYFKLFTKVEQGNKQDRESFQYLEEKFAQEHCPVPLTDDDHFAYAVLCKTFKAKLNQIKQKSADTLRVNFDVQSQHNRLFRVIKTNVVHTLAGTGSQNPSLPRDNLSDEQRAQIVRQYSCGEGNLYRTMTNNVDIRASPSTNFGLNDPNELSVRSIPFEMNQILKALQVIPQVPETRTLKAIKQNKRGDASRYLKVNNVLHLAKRGANPSQLDNFDGLFATDIIQVKVTDAHRQDFATRPTADLVRHWKPHGTLVTTLYEHKMPVNTVTVTDDEQFFMTGSKDECKVLVWNMQNIDNDRRSSQVKEIQTEAPLNQLQMISNSARMAIATQQGIQIHDFTRLLQTNQPRSEELQVIKTVDEVLHLKNVTLPVSYTSVIMGATQSGHMLIYDLRARHVVSKFSHQIFSTERGSISALDFGRDGYSLTAGSLGGYVGSFDLRYGLQTCVYKHHLNWPVLAMATYRNPASGSGMSNTGQRTMISMGGNQHEVCELSLETGAVEVLYRVSSSAPNNTGSIVTSKHDIPMVPEFVRENNFKDQRIGTLKRDTNLRMFDRTMLYARSNLQQQLLTNEKVTNISNYYLDMSRSRFKLLSESYQSPNACRSILIPRNLNQSFAFDGETSTFALTAGNDRKIRYWDLMAPEKQSYQLNTPSSDEVQYFAEQVTRDTKLVVEKQMQKSFPKPNASLLKEVGMTQPHQVNIKGQSSMIKYQDNSSYFNSIASVLHGKNLTTPLTSNHQMAQVASGQAVQAAEILQTCQTTQEANGGITVNNFNGTSQGQHLNNLALISGEAEQENGSEWQGSELVSHSDAILDMAICQEMLITTSRDNLVKIWK